MRRQSTNKRESKFKSRRDKLVLGNIIACTGVGALYILSGSCGYWAFGSTLKADVLLNYNDIVGFNKTMTILVNIIRICFAFVVAFSFPIYAIPSIQSWWHLYSLKEMRYLF